MQRAPLLQRRQRAVDVAVRDRHGAARLRRDARRHKLGAHAARRIAGRRLAAHRLDLRRDRRHHGNVCRRGIAARVGGVEAVDVGQQHELVGLHHFGDARGKAVIVAETDFRGRDGVVLVDHRDAAEAQQRVQRGARVEVAAAVLGVVERQQQLRGGEVLRRQRLAPGLRQPDLPDRGGRLLFLQPQPALLQPERRGAPGRWRRRRPRSRPRRARAARRCRRRRHPATRCAARPRPDRPPARCRSSRRGAGRRRGRGSLAQRPREYSLSRVAGEGSRGGASDGT